MTSNRYAPPKAAVAHIAAQDTAADISGLPVSDSWKTKFYLIEKAGGLKMTRLRALSFSERMKVGANFNLLAFLFGPVYYAVKGMWKKGLALFGAIVVVILLIGFLLELAGLGRFANSLGYGGAAIYAMRANIDYYKKMVLKQNDWW
jgi:Protein of unknown function (DUF2628)